jgi:hypothetical protein
VNGSIEPMVRDYVPASFTSVQPSSPAPHIGRRSGWRESDRLVMDRRSCLFIVYEKNI